MEQHAAHPERVRPGIEPRELQDPLGHRRRVDACCLRTRSPVTPNAADARQDCAKYLNGRGKGNRYEGTLNGAPRTGSCAGLTGKRATFSNEYKTFLRQMFEAQVRVSSCIQLHARLTRW